MKSVEEAYDFFKNDQYAVPLTGIEIVAVNDNYAKCSLKIQKKHLNAANEIMGGVFFTLADFVFAICTNTPDSHTVTTTSQITYLGKVKGDTLICESKILKNGRTLCTYEMTITDNLGNIIAVVISSGMKVS